MATRESKQPGNPVSAAEELAATQESEQPSEKTSIEQRIRINHGNVFGEVHGNVYVNEPRLHGHSRWQDLADWVSTIDAEGQFNSILQLKMAGTGGWLRDNEGYSQWQNGKGSSILWLHGLMGSGKSTLITGLIDETRGQLTQECDGKVAVFHFYLSRSSADPRLKDAVECMRCILRQSLRACGDFSGPCLKRADAGRLRNKDRLLALPEVLETISECQKVFSRTYLFIDALDECNEEQQESLVSYINKLMDTPETTLKIFITSRDYARIVNIMKHHPAVIDVAIEGMNKNDIDAYIQQKIPGIMHTHQRRLGMDTAEATDLSHRISSYLSENAAGMFRWVELQIRFLARIRTRAHILDVLGSSAPDLMETYRALYKQQMASIDIAEEKHLIQKILQWVLVAQDLLTVESLLPLVSHGAAKQISVDDLSNLIEDWIVITEFIEPYPSNRIFSNHVRFAHLSVREFLQGHGHELFPPVTINEGHEDAFVACIDTMVRQSQLTAQEEPPSHLEIGFLYSIVSWRQHAAFMESHDPSPRYRRAVQTMFDPKSPMYAHWYNVISRISEINSFSHVKNWQSPMRHVLLEASQYNFIDSIDEILSHLTIDEILRTQDSLQGNALHVAVKHGYLDVAAKIISKGILIDVGPEPPLNVAIRDGQTQMASWLLEQGASATLRARVSVDDQRSSAQPTALIAALEMGLSDISLPLLELWSQRRSPESQNELLSAAAYGSDPADFDRIWSLGSPSEDYVSLEIRDAVWDPTHVSVRLMTPFYCAFRGNNLVMLSHLSQTWDNNQHQEEFLFDLANSKDDGLFDQILHKYAGNKLTETLVRICQSTAQHWTAAYRARLVLGKGIDANVADANGRLPLHEACRQHNIELIQVLLEHGADPNDLDQESGTALHALTRPKWLNRTSITECQDMINLLIAHGANVHAVAPPYGSIVNALFEPNETGGFAMELGLLLELFLEYGVSIATMDHTYNQPLYAACFNADFELVTTLLQHGADPECGGRDGTPVSAALRGGFKDVVDLLESHGAVYDPAGDDARACLVASASNTKFLAASASNSLEAFARFANRYLEAGGDVNAVSIDYGTNALCMACYDGNIGVVGYLLDHGASVNGNSAFWGGAALHAIFFLKYTHWTPLHHICMLFEREPNHIMESGYMRPSEEAAQLLSLLLQHGPDVNARCVTWSWTSQASKQPGHYWFIGCTPLHFACGMLSDHSNAETLLAAGANPNLQSAAGYTPLHLACLRDKSEIALLLLDYNAEPSTLDADGRLAAYYSVCKGSEELVKALIDRGAPLEIGYGEYVSALQSAARHGKCDTLSLLIAKGAKVNSRGGRYGSPLRAALLAGYERAARLLWSHGARRGSDEDFTIPDDASVDEELSLTEDDLGLVADDEEDVAGGLDEGTSPTSHFARMWI